MECEIVSYETAKLAKKKGFTLDTLRHYWLDGTRELTSSYDSPASTGNVSKNYLNAPTQSLLARWLRERQTDVTVITNWGGSGRTYSVGLSYVNASNEVDIWVSKGKDSPAKYLTHEEALEAGLAHALALL